MVRGRTCFHADEARRKLGKIVDHLRSAQPNLRDRVALGINRMDLEHVLGDIQTDDTSLRRDGSCIRVADNRPPPWHVDAGVQGPSTPSTVGCATRIVQDGNVFTAAGQG